MADSRSHPAPKGLGSHGRRFWKRVISTYQLRVDELILLESACKTIDRVQALDDAMEGQPLTTTGSMGQQREHPLLSEARQQRAYLNRTLAQLDLPDLDSAAKPNQHRSAAQSRWATAHGQGAS
jgi:hypothetical protein